MARPSHTEVRAASDFTAHRCAGASGGGRGHARPEPGARVQRSRASGPHRRPHLQPRNKAPAGLLPAGLHGRSPRAPARAELRPSAATSSLVPRGRRERRARARRAPRRRLTAPRQPAGPPPPSPPRRRLKATASLAPRALSNWPRRPQNGATAGVGTAGIGQDPSAPRTHSPAATAEPATPNENSPRGGFKRVGAPIF